MKNIACLIKYSCICLLLLGCQPQSKTPLHFFFRGDLAEIDTTTELIYQFEKKHPDIDVIMDVNQIYLDNLLYMGKTNQPLDVVFVELRELKPLFKEKHLLPLDNFVSNDNDIILSTFYPDVVNAFYRDDQLYVLPRDIAPHGYLYYNQSILKKANIPLPDNNWSWPEQFLNVLIKVSEFMDENDKTSFVFSEDWFCFETIALSNGLTYDEILTPHLLSPKKRQALLESFTIFHAMQTRFKKVPDHFDKSELFINGKLAFFFSGYWRTPYYRINNDFNWDIILFPKGPQGPRRFPAGSSGYAISKNTSNPQKAWELVKFLSGKPGQTALTKAGVIQPANKALLQEKYFGINTQPLNKQALTHAANNFLFQPTTDNWIYIRYTLLEEELWKIAKQPSLAPELALKRYTEKVLNFQKKK